MNLLPSVQMAKQSISLPLLVLRPWQQLSLTAMVRSIAPRGSGYLHSSQAVFYLAGIDLFGGGFYCIFCHSKDKHHPLKCPMLAKLNLKLIKVGGGSSGGVGIGSKSPMSGPLATGTSGTPGAKVAAAVSHATPSKVSPSAPVGMTVALVVDGEENSTDSFRWDGDGDGDGVTIEDAHKPKALVSSYAPSSSGPLCCNLSVESSLPSPTCSATQLGDNIVLPPTLIQSLLKAIPTTNRGTPFRLVVANTGATDHMVPDRGAFIS